MPLGAMTFEELEAREGYCGLARYLEWRIARQNYEMAALRSDRSRQGYRMATVRSQPRSPHSHELGAA